MTQTLMAIFAHPDDEGAMGGTLAQYAATGSTIVLVCGTRGEVGEISDPSLATRETLGEVRQKELEAASAALGIQHLEWLNYRDSGMQGTPENEDQRALINADPAKIKKEILDLISRYDPQVVVTFEPFGWYGHPDHIAVSKWVTDLFNEEPALKESRRLYHSVIPFSRFKEMMAEAVKAGLVENDGFLDQIPEEQQLATEAKVTHVIDVLAQISQKQAATAAHKTQFGEDHMFNKLPDDIRKQIWGNEQFILIYPEPDSGLATNRHSDLFV